MNYPEALPVDPVERRHCERQIRSIARKIAMQWWASSTPQERVVLERVFYENERWLDRHPELRRTLPAPYVRLTFADSMLVPE